MGFRTSDPQRMRWVKVATEMSSLVSMLFRTFLNPLKFLMEIFNILVILILCLITCLLSLAAADSLLTCLLFLNDSCSFIVDLFTVSQ